MTAMDKETIRDVFDMLQRRSVIRDVARKRLTDSLRRAGSRCAIVQSEEPMTRLLFVLALTACSITPKPVAAPVTSSSELAVRRAQLISWLHDYRVAAVYPTDGAQPISVFVDSRGVRCPMAEMIHMSGRDDLVEAVHRENNKVRLANVHSGPLFDWMLSSGLTQEEIVLVQGAMNIEPGNWVIESPLAPQLAIATVSGQLEMAESMLRSATTASLAIATKRLPSVPVAVLATSPIAGRVVLASRR
jgi:hypothetical protein